VEVKAELSALDDRTDLVEEQDKLRKQCLRYARDAGPGLGQAGTFMGSAGTPKSNFSKEDDKRYQLHVSQKGLHSHNKSGGGKILFYSVAHPRWILMGTVSPKHAAACWA